MANRTGEQSPSSPERKRFRPREGCRKVPPVCSCTGRKVTSKSARSAACKRYVPAVDADVSSIAVRATATVSSVNAPRMHDTLRSSCAPKKRPTERCANLRTTSWTVANVSILPGPRVWQGRDAQHRFPSPALLQELCLFIRMDRHELSVICIELVQTWHGRHGARCRPDALNSTGCWPSGGNAEKIGRL